MGLWGAYPFQDYFESPHAWFVVFGLIVVSRLIIFATVAALIGGVLWMRCRWTGRTNRFLSRKVLAAVGIMGVVSILGVSFVKHAETRLHYHSNLLSTVGSQDSADPEKVIMLATEVIRLSKKIPGQEGNALRERAGQYVKLGKFNEAVADYEEAHKQTEIHFFPYYKGSSDQVAELRAGWRAPMGEAKLAAGDYRGAIADLDWVLEHRVKLWTAHTHLRTHAEVYYNRGYAHEKLGETVLAIADYDEAIRLMEQEVHESLKRVYSIAARPGYDTANHRSTREHRPGFRITQDELQEIRDRLAQ